MCLPFSCGGGGDHGSPAHHGFHHPHPRPHPPPPLSPPPRYVPSPDQDDDQPYKTFVVTPPFQEAYGQRDPGKMAAVGKGMNGGADVAPRHHVAGVTKNDGEHMHDDPYASIQGRKSGAENVHVAPTLAAQAPHQRRDVYSAASPPLHGRPVMTTPHQEEHTERMRAPAVVHMARRGGEDNYAATTPMTPAANNLYNDRGHAYGDEGNRKLQGNSWW